MRAKEYHAKSMHFSPVSRVFYFGSAYPKHDNLAFYGRYVSCWLFVLNNNLMVNDPFVVTIKCRDYQKIPSFCQGFYGFSEFRQSCWIEPFSYGNDIFTKNALININIRIRAIRVHHRRYFLLFIVHARAKAKKKPFTRNGHFLSGGGVEIWTRARESPSNGLANRPLRPLGYASNSQEVLYYKRFNNALGKLSNWWGGLSVHFRAGVS